MILKVKWSSKEAARPSRRGTSIISMMSYMKLRKGK